MAHPRKHALFEKNPAKRGYKITQEMRDNVSLWVMAGISEVAMAARFGISHDTLRRRFAEELRSGREQWRMHVLRLLMQAAEGGNVTAMRALLNRSDAVYSPSDGDAPAKTPKLGKKEQAQEIALTAERGSDWEHLLKLN